MDLSIVPGTLILLQSYLVIIIIIIIIIDRISERILCFSYGNSYSLGVQGCPYPRYGIASKGLKSLLITLGAGLYLKLIEHLYT